MNKEEGKGPVEGGGVKMLENENSFQPFGIVRLFLQDLGGRVEGGGESPLDPPLIAV